MDKNFQTIIKGGITPVVAADFAAEPDSQKVLSKAMGTWKKKAGGEIDAASFKVVQQQYLVEVKNSQGEVIDTLWVSIQNKQ